MELLHSDLREHEKNTLYIIGNGFDLFHGLKTKYVHFYSWLNLQDKEHEQFVVDMETLIPCTGIHGNMLWMDFEKTLGKFDEHIDSIHRCFAGKEENDIFDEEFQKRAAQKFHDVVDKIPIYLREWVNSIDIFSLFPQIDLSPQSTFLTFNYTLLLEKIYQIPSPQILHIHSSLESTKPLVTGHNNSFPEGIIEHNSYNIEKSWQNIAIEGNNLQKPVYQLIKDNFSFFNSLKDKTHIVVFGHSMSGVDWPYYNEILRFIPNDANWYFVVPDEKEMIKYERIVNNHNKFYSGHVINNSQFIHKMKPDNCRYINIQHILKRIEQ